MQGELRRRQPTAERLRFLSLSSSESASKILVNRTHGVVVLATAASTHASPPAQARGPKCWNQSDRAPGPVESASA